MPEAQYGEVNIATNLRYRTCFTCNAVIPLDKITYHNNFHKTFSNRIGDDMSRVSWCDANKHAFERDEPGSASFTGTEVDESGVSHDKTMDYCAQHNPMAMQREAAKYQLTPKAYEALSKPDHPFED